MNFFYWGILAGIVFAGCSPFEYHPYDGHLGKAYKNINNRNIERIKDKDRNADNVRFIFMGDTQRCYDETEDFMRLPERKLYPLEAEF